MLVYKVVVTIKHPQYKPTTFLGLYFTPGLVAAKAEDQIKRFLQPTLPSLNQAEIKITFNRSDYVFSIYDQLPEEQS